MKILPSSTPLIAALLCACGTAEDAAGPGPDPLELAAAWVAEYRGSGVGQVDGQPFEVDDAVLRIDYDADSLRRQGCTACVTVTLDQVFALANVTVDDPVELTLTYDDGPVRYSLELTRGSVGGTVGSSVQARARIGNIGVATPFFDVGYLLER